jgi:hypothetical protein
MAEKNNHEKPTIIKLEDEDIRTGLNIVGQAQSAQAKVQALSEIEQNYIQRLAQKYKVDLQHYQLRDWLTGFEPRE